MHPPRSLNPFAVLGRHRDYRVFWTGQALSLVGTWMQTMAQGWLALELSGSALVVGLVASANALPTLLLSLPAGALADRADRLRLIRIAQVAFFVEATGLWLLVATGTITVPLLVGIALLHGAISSIEIPARQSFVVELVGREDLQPAIALNSSAFNLARVVGPALGGLIIARFGLAWCFLFNAASYGFVVEGLRRIRRPPIRRGTASGGVGEAVREAWRGTRDAIAHFLEPGDIRDILGLVAVGSVFAGSFLPLMPVFARERLGMGAAGYGSLLSVLGIGGLTGALLLAGPLGRVRKRPLYRAATLAFPLLLLLLSAVRTPALALALLPALGASMITFAAMSNTMLQTLVDDAYRGRLMAVYAMLVIGLSQSLGAFGAGAVARAVGVEWAMAVGASVTAAYAAALLWRRHAARVRAAAHAAG